MKIIDYNIEDSMQWKIDRLLKMDADVRSDHVGLELEI